MWSVHNADLVAAMIPVKGSQAGARLQKMYKQLACIAASDGLLVATEKELR